MAETLDGWREILSFSERLQVISKMQVTYKTVHPECTSSDASKWAKKSEEASRKEASSLQEYEDLCTKSIQLLHSSVQTSKPGGDEVPDDDFLPNIPTAGVRIGRYTNASHFKDGLFSKVFSATKPIVENDASKSTISMREFVALKVTNPAMTVAPHDSVREARIFKSAAPHSNIVPLLETFEQAGGHFVLVFPFMPLDLSTLLQNHQVNTNIRRRSLLRDVFSGLAHLHSIGILHRDIKPSNILISPASSEAGETAYLSDFGIAWSPTDPASEPADQKHHEVGTASYRPPELLFGSQTYGSPLDMWAAGCVAAQVVCLDEHTLFDSGDLGSELALIRSQFETLGTPDETVWPEANQLPDWGKMAFRKFPGMGWEKILTEASPGATHLVSCMVRFESGKRLTAAEALQHPYLTV
ncbi:serine/threonine-protein kinase pctaire-3 [Polychaeton citri CBS 116435]|uniref:cyclin-dependent kinase n=1 Tax=Polychaeton citri CBS 116435 TaxID=1314669 RepID=A0A9P4QGA1_9PEZI|nr:serine/threonine-protein kinase pctaire-3 [Polychaeton citri CBS 116435]